MKKIMYHGTNRDFTKFNRFTDDETNLLQEIFFTTNYEEAKDYAYSRVECEEEGIAKVLTVEVEFNNVMTGNLEEDFKAIYNNDEDNIKLLEKLKDDFQGNDTIEFFEYCSQKNKVFEDGCTVQDINDIYFNFDCRKETEEIYTSINADNCKIINIEVLEIED